MLGYREQHKKSIRFFNDREVRTMWDEENNKWYLTLLQRFNEQDSYHKTRNYWKFLTTKLKKENNVHPFYGRQWSQYSHLA